MVFELKLEIIRGNNYFVYMLIDDLPIDHHVFSGTNFAEKFVPSSSRFIETTPQELGRR